MRWLTALLVLSALPHPVLAQDESWAACRRAIALVEPGAGTPPGLLLAIALVESGRSDPRTGRFDPWPWSWNVEGTGGMAPSRAAAAAELGALLAAGRRSIDVGCMQVNLLHHPAAFPTPADGFDPVANIRYAAGFLRALHGRFGNWAEATANYHSGDPGRGLGYQSKVALAQLGAAWGAGGGAVTLPAMAGLCARGMRPVLQIKPRAPRPRIGCKKV